MLFDNYIIKVELQFCNKRAILIIGQATKCLCTDDLVR